MGNKNQFFLTVMGFGVAVACMLWVIGHLVCMLLNGNMLIGEPNKSILLVEIMVTSIGAVCLCKVVFGGKR